MCLSHSVAKLWQYWLWSFQGRDTKKQLKSLYFLKWCPIFDNSPLLQLSISFNCSRFLAKKTFLILYPSLENSTTSIAIVPIASFQWSLMLILLETLVIRHFLTLAAQLQQAGVGISRLLNILVETLILVGMNFLFIIFEAKKIISTTIPHITQNSSV